MVTSVVPCIKSDSEDICAELHREGIEIHREFVLSLIDMLRIDDTIFSFDILEKKFICDLAALSGKLLQLW